MSDQDQARGAAPATAAQCVEAVLKLMPYLDEVERFGFTEIAEPLIESYAAARVAEATRTAREALVASRAWIAEAAPFVNGVACIAEDGRKGPSLACLASGAITKRKIEAALAVLDQPTQSGGGAATEEQG